MTSANLITSTCALVFAIAQGMGFAAAAQPRSISHRIVGEWQQGLNDKNKDAPIIENVAAGILGPVYRFKADKTFVVYFPCNIDMQLKLKDVVTKGVWEVANGTQLKLTITERGDWRGPMEVDGEVVISSKRGHIQTLTFDDINAGRFDGARANCGQPTKHLNTR